MTAVAEQAMALFRAEVLKAVEGVTTDDPLDRFEAVGTAYLHWAIHSPTHFQTISTRSLIDCSSSQSLRDDNLVVRTLMEQAIIDAQQQGKLCSNNMAETHVTARALVYGLRRMYTGGHFAQWTINDEAVEQTARNTLRQFVSLL